MNSILALSQAKRVKKTVIMVMGVQRSGTTALFKSLARDPALTSFHESPDDALYYLYHLRSLREIAPILDAAPGAVLLKPINETFVRSLEDLWREYSNYALKLVWIYRDPVNVLSSMMRKGWLPSGLEGEKGAGAWVARNRLALQFQEDRPDMITLVRYEDLIADPGVFRALCGSLGVNGKAVFREDRGTGRQDIPLATQRAIYQLTRATLRALDASRTFRPGRIRRWKSAAAASFARVPARRRPRRTATLQPPHEWTKSVAATSPTLPSELDDLVFWLNAGGIAPLNGRIQEVEESGPLGLRALADNQPPFCIPFLNGQPALFFPTNKAQARLDKDPGLLRFTAPGTKRLGPLQKSFSGFALIKPHIPVQLRGKQERTVALAIRAGDERARFVLEWDRTLGASRAIARTGDRSDSVSSVCGSHPHQQWRIIHFQFQAEDGAQFSISADGIGSVTSLASGAPEPASDCRSEWLIELGGSESDPAALFYGAIAEVILFSRALRPAEQFGITKYLKQKYQL